MDRQPLLAIGADPQGRLGGVEYDLALAAEVPGAVVVGRNDDPVRRLIAETGAYRLLLLSSHLLHDEAPIGAAIRLAVRYGKGFVARDVSTFELLRLRLRADRVVLSGCTGALPAGGAELLSVANALLAGVDAEAVIATPYRVSDLGASLLWAELLPPLLDPATSAEAALETAIATLGSLTAATCESYLSRLASRSPAAERLALAITPAFGKLAAGWNGRDGRDTEPLLPVTDLSGWAVLG